MKDIEATTYDNIRDIVEGAHRVVIIQADNPDGDSLGTALALEHIIGDLGGEPLLYCAVDMPQYLRYLEGWDRVSDEMPRDFDAAIIVDTSTPTLLEKLTEQGYDQRLHSKPTIVLDHHQSVEQAIAYADIIVNDASKSSTGELLYAIAQDNNWPINKSAAEHIMTAILGDTQGLSNDLASPSTYRVMAALIELGAQRPELEEKRRKYDKMPEVIFRYKAQLIERTQLDLEGKLAFVVLSQDEINQYSPLYNPTPLIQNDMLHIYNVGVAVVLKRYDDGKITGAIRANNEYPHAASIATALGGGGHLYAAGFKLSGTRTIDEALAIITTTLEQALTMHSNDNQKDQNGEAV